MKCFYLILAFFETFKPSSQATVQNIENHLYPSEPLTFFSKNIAVTLLYCLFQLGDVASNYRQFEPAYDL